MFILVHDDGFPLALGNGDGDDLGIEKRLLLRAGGVVVGAHRKLILVLARQGALATEVLGGFDHAAGDGVVFTTGGFAGFLEAIAKDHVSTLRTPANIAAHGVLGTRHGFGAAGDDHLGRAGSNVSGGGHDGLQAGAAATVELHAGNGDGQASIECGDAAEGRCSTVGGSLAEDNVIDDVWVDAGFFHDGGHHQAGQILDGDGFERAAVTTDWGALGVTQDNVLGIHGFSLGNFVGSEIVGNGRARSEKLREDLRGEILGGIHGGLGGNVNGRHSAPSAIPDGNGDGAQADFKLLVHDDPAAPPHLTEPGPQRVLGYQGMRGDLFERGGGGEIFI